MSGYTPGPWAQGVTLRTKNTSRWSQKQVENNDAVERRMVFANFSAADEGRSRILIARAERPEDAALIAAAPKMVALLRRFRDEKPTHFSYPMGSVQELNDLLAEIGDA